MEKDNRTVPHGSNLEQLLAYKYNSQNGTLQISNTKMDHGVLSQTAIFLCSVPLCLYWRSKPLTWILVSLSELKFLRYAIDSHVDFWIFSDASQNVVRNDNSHITFIKTKAVPIKSKTLHTLELLVLYLVKKI